MDSFVLVIFGITGNLAQIKLIPAIYDMEEKELLTSTISILGISRQEKTPEQLKLYLWETLNSENPNHPHKIEKAVFERLCGKFHFLSGDILKPDFYPILENHLATLKSTGKNIDNRIFYLATSPDLYETIFNNLKNSRLSSQDNGWTRLIIEKPFGQNLSSAKNLNSLLHKYFGEDQIYRLDHYLGKETLQNILAFRFGNELFEPLINKDYIDHIQITTSEEFGIGKRGGYYDSVGALKDVGQNHLLQMLAFATMDAPSEFSNPAVTKERVKILTSLIPDPRKLVLGQYGGYKNEPKVSLDSKTNTFFAFKTEINNSRFQGIPIYVRGGKKLPLNVAEICVVFKVPLNRLFSHLGSGNDPNVLIYRIQPNEVIVLKVLTKKPGHETELNENFMEFCYRHIKGNHNLLDPHERLLYDAIRGEQTFFNDAEEVEAEWAFVDKLSSQNPEPITYEPGQWGPKEADDLILMDGRVWIEPSTGFCRI